MRKTIKFVDLFAGCGGLSFYFHKDSRFIQIAATDIWDQARKTYEANFTNSNYILADLSKESDFNKVIEQTGTDIDLVLGGPPCKGFSTLNNSKNESKHNTLVDRYLDFVDITNPKVFLLENVRGFTSKKHPCGLTYPKHVISRIKNFKTEYNYEEFLLNAKDYGLAQERIRYFFIAVNKTFDAKDKILSKFLFEINNRKNHNNFVLKDVIGDLPRVPVGGGSDKIKLKNGTNIYNHKSMNHSDKLIKRLKHVPVGGGLLDVPVTLLTNHLKKMVNGGYGSGGFAKNIYGRMDWEKPSGTILAGMDKITCGRFVHPEEDRLLTPRECARIQSFRDDFIFTGGMVSQYYQIGNAVPPKISELFASIFGDIMFNDKGRIS